MNKKSITKNYLYNLTYQILTIILPLITTPYISRVLGAENIGIYSYTLSIATYFVLFGSLGVAMYGQREIAYVRNDEEKRTKTFWEIFILKTSTMVVSLFVYYFTYVRGENYSVYYKILILELVANIADISWFFQGQEEFKKTVTRNIIVKIISVICIFTLVNSKDDLIIYLIIYVLSNLLGNISLWLYLPKYLKKTNFKKLNVLSHLKPTISLFIPQIAMQIYTVLDKTMLGYILKDMSEVGIYEQSQKIIKMPLTIVTALGTVVSPRIANIISIGEKEKINGYLENSFKFVWLIALPIMLGIMAIAPNLVPWFLGDGYEKAVTILIIGAPLIMAVGLNNVSGVQYLIPAKKQNIFTKSVVIGAIFNFTFNLFLIPHFKAIGAIVSSVLAEILIYGVQLFYIRKDIDLKITHKNIWKYVSSSAVMFIVTFCLSRNISPSIINTCIIVFIGIAIYGVSLLMLRDKLIFDLLRKVRNKIIKEN